MRPPYHVFAALGLIAIGTAAARDPQTASGHFGVPLQHREGLAFVRGCGTRDIALGMMLLLIGRKNAALPLALTGALGLADLFTVAAANEKPPLRSLATHLVGTVGAFALAWLAWKERD